MEITADQQIISAREGLLDAVEALDSLGEPSNARQQLWRFRER